MSGTTDITFDANTKSLIENYLDEIITDEDTVVQLTTVVNYIAVSMANKRFSIPALFLFDNDLIQFVIRKVILIYLEEFLAIDNAETIEKTAFSKLSFGKYLETFQMSMIVSLIKRKDKMLSLAHEILEIDLPSTDDSHINNRQTKADGFTTQSVRPSTHTHRHSKTHRQRKSEFIF